MKREVTDRITRTKELQARRGGLIEELEKSLALESLVPGIFDKGSVTTRWTSKYPHCYPKSFTMTVLSDGEAQATFRLKDHVDDAWVWTLKPCDAGKNCVSAPHGRCRCKRRAR